MDLASYGIYPYRLGTKTRYFIEGVHGNFHIGNTDLVSTEVHSFLKSRGGLMKVLNHQDQSSNADNVFTVYGCKEALSLNDDTEIKHPFEKWGVDYYHPHFEFINTKDATFIIYFKKREAFLFLDDRIIFDSHDWISRDTFEDLEAKLEKYARKISAVFSFNCISGNIYHQVTEGILRNKIKGLITNGP